MTLALVTQAPRACAEARASLAMTPVAMGIAKSVGGLPGLTTAIKVFTGIVGYAFGPALIDRASRARSRNARHRPRCRRTHPGGGACGTGERAGRLGRSPGDGLECIAAGPADADPSAHCY